MMYEPVGDGPLATGNVQDCIDFWESFSSNKMILDWIRNGYPLLWAQAPPRFAEFENAPSASEHELFVSQSIQEMLEAGAITELPPGERPTVVSPLGVVPKPRSDKLRLIINMRHVNKHLAKKVFKNEGLKDLGDIIYPGDSLLQYDLTSGYYHVPLRHSSRTYFGLKWKGKYFTYNVLPFGLSTAPYAFSKIMRELVMKWRRDGLSVLPYLDDFLFGFRSNEAALSHRLRIESDFFRSGLRINFEKSEREPGHCRRHLGFMVDTTLGTFSVPQDRWERLQSDVSALLAQGRAPARKISSCVGQIISMGLAWGPVTQLYTRHLYVVINSAHSLNQWVAISEEAMSELMFWQGLQATAFTAPIWASTPGQSIRLACDASDQGWGALTLSGDAAIAHEYFSPWERLQSSTYRELLGVHRCLQALILRCRDSYVVFQVDNLNILSVVNKGSRSLPLNALARELFWYCLEQGVQLRLEWAPRDLNQAADAISKMALPNDWQLHPRYFRWLDQRWGPHSCDLFASSTSAQCARFFSLHWCPGTGGVDAFAYDWAVENPWINAPFRIIGRVWRRLRDSLAAASMVIPHWSSATWWHLVAPDGIHLSEHITDWVWLPDHDRALFIPSQGQGSQSRDMPPPSWSTIAVRVDFTISPGTAPSLPRRSRCLRGGCRACKSHSWHRDGRK